MRYFPAHDTKFQSTLPRRERHGDHRKIAVAGRFQSTLPRRERLQLSTSSSLASLFQSTLPRRERRVRSTNNDTRVAISIHAPAEGATIPHFQFLPVLHIFQSTLPRRERRLGRFGMYILYRHFNPRSRGGSDKLAQTNSFILKISIHAPAEGATCLRRTICTHRRHFNPRSRGGSDVHQQEKGGEQHISIHAPAEGATYGLAYEYVYVKISIHAPAEGATSYVSMSSMICVFQSTLPRRERQQTYTIFSE